MKQWTFITTHGLILTHIAKNPDITARQIASDINVTEWTVHKTIAELEGHGYLARRRLGRRNVYKIKPALSLRHSTLRDVAVGDLLKVLGWAHQNRGAAKKKNSAFN